MTLEIRDALQRPLAAGHGCAIVVDLSHPDTATTDALTGWLTEAERRRAAAFWFAEDRTAYVAAHGALALMVTAVLGRPPPFWRVESEPGGRPVVHTIEGSSVHVSLSHTRGAIALAISHTVPVGIDVESWRAIPDLAILAKQVMAPTEFNAFRLRPEPDLFYAIWTRKEALLKAHGLGLQGGLRSHSVLDVHAPQGPLAAAGTLTLCDLPAPPGMSGALCQLAPHQRVETISLRHDSLLSAFT